MNPLNTQGIKLKSDSRAADFFKKYSPAIKYERQLELLLNVKVLNAMREVEITMETEHGKCGYKKPALVRKSLISLCNKLRKTTQHTLPESPSRLMEKYKAYKEEGCKILVNSNTGNQHTRKVTPIAGRILIRLKRSKFPVYTDMQIFEEYNRIAPQKGLKQIASPNTITNYLNTTAIKLWWYAAVYGERAFKNEFMPLFDTELPVTPNTLWYSDGTKLNLYYREYDDKQKKMVARTIDVYEVMDACTEVFVGYAFGAENFMTQYNAYRMALETWKVKPNEIVTDNQGGHKKLESQGLFKRMCHIHKTTMPHNGQSKTIESAFGRFQSQILHQMYNYTGQNVTATKQSSHVNIDMVVSNIHQLPTLEEMKEQYLNCRDQWNNEQHPTSGTGMTRMEMYATLNCPNSEPLDDYEVQEIFRLFSKESVMYGPKGFCFTLNKQEYKYMVCSQDGTVDMDFHMSNVRNSFRYRYDPQDMTVIELWQDDGKQGLTYKATASTKWKIHRATAERTEDENALLFAQIHKNEKARVAHHIACEELLLEEYMNEAYTRLVIPRPVGVSEKKMKAYREAYEDGKLVAPVQYPEGLGPGTYRAEEEEEPAGISSAGEYTKKTSELTDIELYQGFLN